MTTPMARPSVQLYTVREALAADMPGALARLARIGFERVEGFDLVGLQDRYADALPDSGLAMPSAHVTGSGTGVGAGACGYRAAKFSD